MMITGAPKDINTPEGFQTHVEGISTNLRELANVASIKDFETFQFEKLYPLEEQLYILNDQPEVTADEEKTIFMASVSKVALAKLAFEISKDNPGTTATTTKGRLKRLFEEIIKRDAVEIAKEMPSIKFMFMDDFDSTTYFPEKSLDEELKLNLDELIHLSLVISSNNATTVISEFLQERLGESFSDKIRALAPNLEITVTLNNNAHWTQNGANTGKLSEMVKLLNEIALSEPELVKEMANNPENPGFGFTNSELGQRIIDMGGVIDEKTGSYELGVYWVNNLSQRLPFHAPLLTTVTIKLYGKTFSFGYYQSYELPFPDASLPTAVETMEFDGVKHQIQFPDAENIYFVGGIKDNKEVIRGYVADFEDAAYPKFRQDMANAVGPAINEFFGAAIYTTESES